MPCNSYGGGYDDYSPPSPKREKAISVVDKLKKENEKLEIELCEARSLIFQIKNLKNEENVDKLNQLMTRISDQLAEHKKHREEERQIAIQHYAEKLGEVKDNKERKKVELRLKEILEIDSTNEKFWDRRYGAFQLK